MGRIAGVLCTVVCVTTLYVRPILAQGPPQPDCRWDTPELRMGGDTCLSGFECRWDAQLGKNQCVVTDPKKARESEERSKQFEACMTARQRYEQNKAFGRFSEATLRLQCLMDMAMMLSVHQRATAHTQERISESQRLFERAVRRYKTFMACADRERKQCGGSENEIVALACENTALAQCWLTANAVP